MSAPRYAKRWKSLGRHMTSALTTVLQLGPLALPLSEEQLDAEVAFIRRATEQGYVVNRMTHNGQRTLTATTTIPATQPFPRRSFRERAEAHTNV
jgi:hypothetical protein